MNWNKIGFDLKFCGWSLVRCLGVLATKPLVSQVILWPSYVCSGSSQLLEHKKTGRIVNIFKNSMANKYHKYDYMRHYWISSLIWRPFMVSFSNLFQPWNITAIKTWAKGYCILDLVSLCSELRRHSMRQCVVLGHSKFSWVRYF